MTSNLLAPRVGRTPLYAAIVGGLVAFHYTSGIQADTRANPAPVSKSLMLAAGCNPCAVKKKLKRAACGACNPCAVKAKLKSAACGACNPCAVKKAACGACNPCAVKKAACGACNPCAVKKAACGACNPCAVKKAACGACNPCAVKKAACGACNPCGVAQGPKIIVSGVLVDTRCYGFDNSNVGNKHKMGSAMIPGCATACAKLGIPVAVLDGGNSGGQLYTIASPAPGFADYMSMEARMVGTEIVTGLVLPSSVEVKTASGWKKVAIKGMM